jgi:hypothetical protein
LPKANEKHLIFLQLQQRNKEIYVMSIKMIVKIKTRKKIIINAINENEKIVNGNRNSLD